jgi:MFS family permease
LGVYSFLNVPTFIFHVCMRSTKFSSTVLVGAVQVVASAVACFLMDRAGRRKLLIIAGSLMTITCFTFGAYYFAIKAGRSAETLSWLAVGSRLFLPQCPDIHLPRLYEVHEV